MDTTSLLAYIVFWLLTAIGALGCVLPYPGHLFILGACISASLIGGQQPAWYIWVLIVLLGVVGFFVDNVTAMLGARKFGGTKAAIWGALGGVVVGAFFFPAGLLLGPFLGALCAEYFVARKHAKEAAKAGLGATIGYVTGVIAKMLLAAAMVTVYILAV